MMKLSKFMYKRNKKIVKALVYMLVFIAVFYIGIGVYSYSVVSYYDGKIYPNVYISTYDISGMSINEINDYIDNMEEELQNTKIVFVANEKTYEYTMKDLNVTINKENIANSIKKYQDSLSFGKKLEHIITGAEKVFSYELVYSVEDIQRFVLDLKSKVDCKATNEKLVMGKDRVLTYIKPSASFDLNIDETVQTIEENLYNVFLDNRIELKGESTSLKGTTKSKIDTKVSTYTTTFKYDNSRGNNIRVAANYIDGVILQPGETFSFYKYAGSYNKKGYEYYHGVIGNGVCQVASTLYNTTLLAGLKVTQRYQHADQMPYVEGGLDATVSANASGPGANYKFKNTYKYPVYISAFTKKNKLTIEFWSNKNATNGKIYKTQSVKIGKFAFKTYLITYKDGKQIDKEYIDTSWYKGLLVI